MRSYRGEEQKPLYSRVFLGVKLVPLNSRVRAAVAVCCDYYTVAILKPGLVAIASKDVFERSFERRDYVQEYAARALARVGAVPQKTVNDFIQGLRENKVLEEHRRAAGDLEGALGRLGMSLTRAQRRELTKLIKVRA